MSFVKLMQPEKKPFAFLLLFVLAVIWGSSFILMKRGLEQYTPSQVAAIRLSVAFICLFPFVVRQIKAIEPSRWKFILVSGMLGNGIPAFLFTAAQTRVSSSAAGVLNSLTPVFTVITGYFLFKSTFSAMRITGVFIGLLGAVVLIVMHSEGEFSADVFHASLIVIATLFYGISVNTIRNKLSEVRPVLIAGFALSMAGIPSLIYLLSTDFPQRIASGIPAQVSFMYVCLLAIFGTALSVVLFNYLIKISGALFSTSVTYLIPIVAVLWGVLDGERMGAGLLIGMLMILSGVYLISKK
jgi:drug/metabolite transporter (DMT)-like permease